jgi:hypothetical protein
MYCSIDRSLRRLAVRAQNRRMRKGGLRFIRKDDVAHRHMKVAGNNGAFDDKRKEELMELA